MSKLDINRNNIVMGLFGELISSCLAFLFKANHWLMFCTN